MAVANPERKILVLALIGTAMVSWRELRAGNVPPPPNAYVGTAIVYGSAHIIAEALPEVGLYLAAGWTLYLAYGAMAVREGEGAAAAAGRTAERTTRPVGEPKVTAPRPRRRARPRRAGTAQRAQRQARPRRRSRLPSRAGR